MIGTTISHYKIIEKLGEGGMGEGAIEQDQEFLDIWKDAAGYSKLTMR